MRTPLDILRGRIEAKVNKKVYGAQHAARAAVDKQGRKLIEKGENKVKDAASGNGGAKAKKKKKMGWWPFGGDEEGGQGGVAACPSCGKEIDPSWELCAYCGQDLQAGGPSGHGSAPLPAHVRDEPVPQNPGAPNKTVAINIDELKSPEREIVGWLLVIEGGQKGTDFRIYSGANSIGAGADNDIVVTDEYLSSRHATIRYEDGHYFMIDNNSTNGTYVGEKKITKYELIDNDTIRLGRTHIRIKCLF